MALSTKDFLVLDALDNYEITNQRQLSERSGMSLGHVNNVIKVLVKKGWVKIDNFYQHPDKKRYERYVYQLTPKGLEAKAQLAARFVVSEVKNVGRFKEIIVDKLILIEKRGHTNILFVGPEFVKDFFDKIIKEFALNLVMVGYCSQLEEIKTYKPENYDIALIIDHNLKDIKTVAKISGMPKEKLLPLL
jgi:DNA-binding MarR family transcriptional regulator